MKKSKIVKRSLLAALLCTTLLAGGCASKGRTNESGADLTYWVEFGNQVSAGVKNFDELPQFQKLQKDLGIDIEYIHPVLGQTQEQFNLLLASNELPDIIEYGFYNYPGGPQKAIDDGCIIPLNDVIEKYCPNLKKYLQEHPEVDKMIKTDSGNYYCFPGIYNDEYLLTYSGLIMREDYLEKAGMSKPETIDELETVLKAFKQKLGISIPLDIGSWGLYAVTQAYGVIPELYVDNGTVKYGPMEAGYKEALTTLNRWYSEGLLDNNIASLEGKTINQNVLNGDTGCVYGNTGSGIGTLTEGLKGVEGAKLTAIPYPTLKKGETPFYGQRVFPYSVFGSASISTQCRDIEKAAKVLDYGYSEEGSMLFNFGIEGESYEMIDGYPTYTEKVTKNENGKSMGEMLYYYASPNGIGPFLRDKRYMEQFAALPEQKESIEIWSKTDAQKHMMPMVNLTPEESKEISAIEGELKAQFEAMEMKMIMGVESVDNYDAFISTLKGLGADRYVEIYQAAYDRYASKN